MDLAAFLDNTDNQQITDFSIAANIITLTLEDGGTETIDLSNLDNAGTDDQALSIVGNVLTLEDGGTVDLAAFLDNTDNQQITDFSIAANIITLTLEDGGTETIDLSNLDNSGTDDQTISSSITTANEVVNIAIEDGGNIDINIQDADADPTNENQTVSAGTGITVAQTGQDFEVTNDAPDQTVTITDGGNGNVTVAGTYPNFTIDVPDNTDDVSTVTAVAQAGTLTGRTISTHVAGSTTSNIQETITTLTPLSLIHI